LFHPYNIILAGKRQIPCHYQVTGKNGSRELAKFLAANGQVILPMVELIEGCKIAVDCLLEVLGRSTLEAVLAISAAGVAGEVHRGRRRGEIVRHGFQDGVVSLSNRRMRLSRPRLRRKSGGVGGEVSIPAYEAMREDSRLAGKIWDTMMRGVSTRNYSAILPGAREAVGVSKPSISRESVLATENSAVATCLLESIAERGVEPGVKRLFVIDGSKALRKAIDVVCGSENRVQRCRNQKVKNVVDHLRTELKDQAKSAMRAAFKLS
jgi:transposase-like protein